MGRKPINEKAMSNTERQQRHKSKIKDELRQFQKIKIWSQIAKKHAQDSKSQIRNNDLEEARNTINSSIYCIDEILNIINAYSKEQN